MEKEIVNTKWFTIRVQPNREKGISETIMNEVEKGNLREVYKTLVPIETTVSVKDGKRVKKERIMYPGYIFVEASSYGELEYTLKNIHGATGLLKDRSGNVIPVRQSEIDKMIGSVEESKSPEQLNSFLVDESIMIIDGPFKGFKATINGLNKSKVTVSVSIFGRITKMDLDLIQIDKIKE